nr:hypothetical protein [Tanacetum cinerariifolium]
MEECHNLLTDSVGDSILRHNVKKPLPLGGPLGQVTIQSDFFFNQDLEYLRYGSKGSRHALSILKMKAVYYPDAGLEQRFYIDRHTSEGDRSIVRTHIRILSVVRIKVFSMYGYDYMKKIVLRHADLNEHVIAKRDFKYLYPSDFKDMYLLNLQEDFQLGIESYQTQLNLTKPRWDATGFEYKHDFTVIDSPRAVKFQDRYKVQMMMRFNEIYKFSDGTLQQIDEALDYRVKEFRINKMNLGLNTRFWTRKDVDRSRALMFAIQKWLKIRRIFRNLESFIGGRVRDGDYRLLKPGSESHPSMLNKENYVPWSSRLLRYAKSRPNGKLIHNSILNGPYVRRMIPEPGDAERDVNRISSNPRNRQIAQPGMNMGQDRQMQMIGGNGGNQFRQYAGQNAGNLNGYHAVQNVRNQVAQNPRVQNVGNQNGLMGVQGNGNLVAVRAEGNTAGHNGNQIRCYNCRGVGHFARDCTVRPRRRDAAYLQTQLLIARKKEAEIQLQAEEYYLMAAAADLDEIKEVNANCILMANLQQASSS